MVPPLKRLYSIMGSPASARVACLAAAFMATAAVAQNLCPAAAHLTLPKPRPGTNADPCEGLAVIAQATVACSAEYPADRRLQAHAAGILDLERRRRVEVLTLDGLRKSPERGLERYIQSTERELAQIDSELDARKKRATAAGYHELAEAGYAQKIMSNVVWRYLDFEARNRLTGCATPAGRQAAQEFIGNLAVAFSHGNPIERTLMQRLLQEAPK